MGSLGRNHDLLAISGLVCNLLGPGWSLVVPLGLEVKTSTFIRKKGVNVTPETYHP